ncbi:hypothetical protein CIB48_g3842 [Xylaria polymorpha]|nr:hypothetical protein CIB48_g3842 [Xylaria polymorpha]
MRLLQYLAATVLITGAVADNNVIGPFALRLQGKVDSSIDGYAWACHAGAATEGLCYTAGSAPVSGSVYDFYYNYSYFESYSYPGCIPCSSPPGVDDGTPISLDFETGEFYIASLYDDTAWNITVPTGERGEDLTNFHLCYQWTGGYWYRSLAWVSGFEGAKPQNPSCEPVTLSVVSLAPT